mmetsp:Transcript_43014/g.100804  ORF Transcript_43014/g.100804 Transcript_43014/m.100804 type:complete len:240 (-) Transcript_43014:229-948(-)
MRARIASAFLNSRSSRHTLISRNTFRRGPTSEMPISLMSSYVKSPSTSKSTRWRSNNLEYSPSPRFSSHVRISCVSGSMKSASISLAICRCSCFSRLTSAIARRTSASLVTPRARTSRSSRCSKSMSSLYPARTKSGEYSAKFHCLSCCSTSAPPMSAGSFLVGGRAVTKRLMAACRSCRSRVMSCSPEALSGKRVFISSEDHCSRLSVSRPLYLERNSLVVPESMILASFAEASGVNL